MNYKIILFALLTIICINFVSSKLISNPYSYYKLDESSGEIGVDYMQRFNITSLNTTHWTGNGKINGGYNASDDHGIINNSLNSSLNWSVSFWVNVSGDTSDYSILAGTGASGSSTNANFYITLMSDNTVILNLYAGGGNSIISPKLDIGKWSLIGFIFSDGNVSMFINNSFVGSKQLNYGNFSSNNLQFFSLGGVEHIKSNVTVDEISIWNKVLNYSEINYLYNYGKGTYPFLDIIEHNQSFNSSVIDTSNEGFSINLSYDSNDWLVISANLIYNGTSYLGTKIGNTNNLLFTRSIEIPKSSIGSNTSFYWQIMLTNSSGNYYINSSVKSQTVSTILFQRCNNTINMSYVNFTIYSQTESIRLNSTFYATFNYRIGNGTTKSNYTYQETGTPTNSSFPFCLSPIDKDINVDVDIQYGNVNNYAQNYFYYRNKALTNVTLEQPLYLLNASKSTVTTLRVIDSYQNGLAGYIGHIYLHDTGTDTNKLVGMFKTNYNGQDIAYLNWYDTLYQFDIYDSSDIILKYSAEPFKISATPQTFRIVTVDTGITWLKFNDVVYNLSINNNTRTFLLTFNDPNNHLTHGCLRIVYFNAGNASVISDVCATGTSGTLTYVVPSSNGTYYGIFYGKGSPPKLIDFVIFNSLDYLNDIYTQIGNMDGTILSLMIISLSAFVGIFSPVGFIFMAIVGYIAVILLGFQSMNSGNFQVSFFIFLAIGGYLIWKLRT